MKTLLKVAGLATLLASPAVQAMAEGWTIKDLLAVSGDREKCMNRARSTVASYLFEYGGGNTSTASWTIYGYDLQPGAQDVVIMCPVVSGGVVNAFLVVHSEASDGDRNFTADEIERIWQSGGK